MSIEKFLEAAMVLLAAILFFVAASATLSTEVPVLARVFTGIIAIFAFIVVKILVENEFLQKRKC